MTQVARVQRIRERRERHRGARMPGLGGLNRVHRQRTDGIDREARDRRIGGRCGYWCNVWYDRHGGSGRNGQCGALWRWTPQTRKIQPSGAAEVPRSREFEMMREMSRDHPCQGAHRYRVSARGSRSRSGGIVK
jgi:hypothetical protein